MLQRYYLKILIEAEKKTRRLFWLIQRKHGYTCISLMCKTAKYLIFCVYVLLNFNVVIFMRQWKLVFSSSFASLKKRYTEWLLKTSSEKAIRSNDATLTNVKNKLNISLQKKIRRWRRTISRATKKTNREKNCFQCGSS